MGLIAILVPVIVGILLIALVIALLAPAVFARKPASAPVGPYGPTADPTAYYKKMWWWPRSKLGKIVVVTATVVATTGVVVGSIKLIGWLGLRWPSSEEELLLWLLIGLGLAVAVNGALRNESYKGSILTAQFVGGVGVVIMLIFLLLTLFAGYDGAIALIGKLAAAVVKWPGHIWSVITSPATANLLTLLVIAGGIALLVFAKQRIGLWVALVGVLVLWLGPANVVAIGNNFGTATKELSDTARDTGPLPIKGEIILERKYKNLQLFAIGDVWRKVKVYPGFELCLDPITEALFRRDSKPAVKYVKSLDGNAKHIYFYYMPYGHDCQITKS